MAKRAAAVKEQPEVVDVGTLTPVERDSSSVLNFLRGFKQFLQRAGTLEADARLALMTAKTWTKPTSKEEDQALVEAVRQVKVDQKAFQREWEVTTLLSRFHKQLTSKRNVGDEDYDEAIRLGENHHDGWVRDEEKRVAEEARRDRERAEAEAEAKKQAELQRLDDEATALEKSMPTLSEREQHFATFIANNNPPTMSARVAGFQSPEATAVRLLSTEKIITAIRLLQEKHAVEQQRKATAAAPVKVATQKPEKAQVAAASTYTWSAEVYDEEAFIAAALDPMTRVKLGIPAKALTFKQAELNAWARELHERIDHVPGLRHKKTPGLR